MPTAVAAAAATLMLARARNDVRSDGSAANRSSLLTADEVVDRNMNPSTSVESPRAPDSRPAARGCAQLESNPSVMLVDAESLSSRLKLYKAKEWSWRRASWLCPMRWVRCNHPWVQVDTGSERRSVKWLIPKTRARFKVGKKARLRDGQDMNSRWICLIPGSYGRGDQGTSPSGRRNKAPNRALSRVCEMDWKQEWQGYPR